MYIKLYIYIYIIPLTFFLEPPVLLQNSTTIVIIEGYSFSLNIQQTEGFPIVPDDYEWSFDGTPISEGESNPNISIYPVIIFTNVNRTDSGNYSITVSNKGGTSTGFIILNVLCELCSIVIHVFLL